MSHFYSAEVHISGADDMYLTAGVSPVELCRTVSRRRITLKCPAARNQDARGWRYYFHCLQEDMIGKESNRHKIRQD